MGRKFFSAVFLQYTGIVGAGIFVLPFVFYHSNLIFSSIFLLFLTIIVVFLHRFYIDIILATPGDHQLAGYAKIYLNRRYYFLALFNLLLLSIGAIIVYQKLFVSFLSSVFSSSDPIYFSYLFVGLIFISQVFTLYKSSHNFFTPLLILLVPACLFILSLDNNQDSSVAGLYLPPATYFYGPLVFALSGFTILPEVEEVIRGTRLHHRLPLVSFLGQLLASFTYLVFTIAIIRLSGSGVTPDTVSGLRIHFPVLGIIVSLLGIAIVFRAAQNFQIITNEIFHRDFGLSVQRSQVLSFCLYLLPSVIASTSLLAVISITGAVTIFISALIICLIRFRLPRNFFTDFQLALVLFCFTSGLIYTLFF